MTPNHEELIFPFLLLALPALLILVLGLIRGTLTPAVGLLVIVVMPASSFTLGNLVLMERAKSVEFCASCHEMANVAYSANQGGEDLASTHFRGHFPRRQGCYECHSGYGIWGDVDAKISGVKHMWATFTNSAHYPLEHTGPFDVAGCLKCHEGAASFAAQPAHIDPDIRASIDSGELGCAGGCHPPAHAAESLIGPHRGPLERFRRAKPPETQPRPEPSAQSESTARPEDAP